MAVINGTPGDDFLVDTTGNDNISGGDGNDTILIRAGSDVVSGGDGEDRLFIDWSTDLSNFTSGTPSPTTGGGFSATITDSTNTSVAYSAIEHITITTGSGADVINTGGGQDIIRTGTGNDRVNAGAGDDIVTGGAGNDTMDGGLGVDTAVIANTAVNLIAIQMGATLMLNREGSDTLNNFERIQFTNLTPDGDNLVMVVAGDGVVEAADDEASVDETGSVTVDAAHGVLLNDLDIDDPMTVTGVAAGGLPGAVGVALAGEFGVLALNANGSYSYTASANSLKAGETADDVFLYTVRANGATDTALLTIHVQGQNDAPTAAAVVLAPIAENSGVRVITQAELLVGSSDVDGDALGALDLAIASGGGVLVDNGDGTWGYTPADDDESGVSFSFNVSDGLESVANSATLDITAGNAPPTAVLVLLAPIAEDSGARLITQAELLVGATDPDGDSLTALGLAIASGGGTLLDNGDGSWSFTAAANDDSMVIFSFEVSDGTASATGAAVLDIAPVNDAPAVVEIALAPLAEDGGARLITQAELLAAASDVEGDSLTALDLAIASGGGALVDNGDGSWSYTAAPNDDTEVFFSFNVSDGTASVANSAVLDLTSVNDAPVATDDSYFIAEDTELSIPAPALLGNDADVDGDPLTAVLVSSTANGTLTLNADGSFSYAPDANFSGSDSFTYLASDGVAQSNVATVSIGVNAVNDDPIANGDSYSTDEDTVLSITAPALLGNDTDVDGDALTAVLVTGPASGSLVLNADGSFTYTPGANFNGSDSFTYRVSDGVAPSNVATASIAVNAVNDAPVAADDSASVDEDATTANLRNALLANDSDADAGDTKTIAAVDTTGTLGTVLFDAATGDLRYRADADAFDALDPGETATDSFFYTVRDGAGATSTARVTMTIAGVPDDGEMLLIDGGNGKDNIFGTAAAERILAGNGKDVVHAGAGNDSISGGEGKDELFGEAGNDTLEGGTGHDLLSGGAGDDTFIFRKGEAGGDSILDFEAAGGAENDTLVLDGYGPGATLSHVGHNYTVSFVDGQEKFWLSTTSLDAGDVLFT